MAEEFKDSQERAEFLRTILANPDEGLRMRSHAALYLGHFEETQVIDLLIERASDEKEPDQLLLSCGDAIAEIWDRDRSFDLHQVLGSVAPVAGQEIRTWLSAKYGGNLPR